MPKSNSREGCADEKLDELQDISGKRYLVDMLNMQTDIDFPGRVASPSPPYGQTATPINTLAWEPKEDSRIEHSDTPESLSEEDADDGSGLKSPLARRQNRSYGSAAAKRISRDAAGRVVSRHDQANQRPAYDRIQIRRELYEHSLHSLVDYTRTSLSSESTGKLMIFARDSALSDRVELEMRIPEVSSGSAKDWLILEYVFCLNIALAVYANCRRLQRTGLAGEYFSILGLLSGPRSRGSVVTLYRVLIQEVQNLVEALAGCIRGVDMLHNPLQAGAHDHVQKLEDSMLRVNHFCKGILSSFGDHIRKSTLTEERLRDDLKFFLQEPFKREAGALSLLFLEWQCVLQALDVGVLAYAGAHVSDFEELIWANEARNFLFPEPSLASRGTHQSLQAANRIHCRHMGLKCLAPFLEDREVWVFDSSTRHGLPPLYLAADIETFADCWGPVWKVADSKHPGLVAKYNVGGGSILSWRFDARVHPQLQANERLCHWRSNADYIRGNGASSPSFSKPCLAPICAKF